MSFNTRSPAVKRLMREAEELNTPTELFYAQPLEDNIFEWHFTIRGPAGSDFEGGIYHGRILLPAEYPMKPPSIIMLTQNGRFRVHEKICLSISGHHPETWLPSWSIRTALLAMIGFMPTQAEGAIGSLDYTSEERKCLARKSVSFYCSICDTCNQNVLPSLTDDSNGISAEAKELAAQIDFKNMNKAVSTDHVDIPHDSTPMPEQVNEVLKRRPTVSESPEILRTIHQPTNLTTNRASVQSMNENNLILYFVFFLSTIIVFLLFRRIYLMVLNF